MSDQSLPKSARIAAGLQALIAVLVLAVWTLWASWGVISWRHFMLSGIVFFPAFALCAIAYFGLKNGMMSGWVTGLIGNGASVAILLIFAWPIAAFPLGLVIYLLLPPVRDFYVRNYYR